MNVRLRRHQRAAGFTLIELMMVIMMLGILAAIVAPQFNNTNDIAQESAVQAQLHTLRGQIQVYRGRHGSYPADLQTLTTAGFLAGPPIHPGEGEFAYDATSGVVTSSVNADW